MARYLLRRSLILLVSLLGGLLAIFVLLRLLPGDPANALLSIEATPEQIAAAQAQVGSDQPVWVQLGRWAQALLQGDLGSSFVSGRAVAPEIAQRLSVTLPLTAGAFVLAVLAAAGLGYLAAIRSGSRVGTFLTGLTSLGIAVPVFWVGILLVWLFALKLRWLPSGGFPRTGWEDPAAVWRAFILPGLTIVIVMTASLSRYVRAAVLDVMASDYLINAQALGSGFGQAFLRHGLRNAAAPVISILGIELASTLLGAVVVESVFTLPGLGSMLTRAIEQHDYPNIQGVLLVSTVFVLVVGFAADIVQRLVDPRLRRPAAGGVS